MKFYFRLQYKMLSRKLTGFGLNPLFGYALLITAFIGISIYFFTKTQFAKYIYVLLATSLITSLNENERTGFLKSCFSGNLYYKIRIIENLFLTLPFVLFLIYKSCFLVALMLLIISISAAFISFNTKLQFTIPTPFFKQPFEFLVGFRKLFWVFIGCYLLTLISISVNNFNLGIFSLLLSFLMCLSFYMNIETEYYVWIYSLNVNQFLFQKIKIALLQSTFLCLPIAVALCLFFSKKIYIVLGFQGLGYIYLITIVFAKYSDFPGKMSLPQTMLIALSICFPPLLLLVSPYFYAQSFKKLTTTLK